MQNKMFFFFWKGKVGLVREWKGAIISFKSYKIKETCAIPSNQIQICLRGTFQIRIKEIFSKLQPAKENSKFNQALSSIEGWSESKNRILREGKKADWRSKSKSLLARESNQIIKPNSSIQIYNQIFVKYTCLILT